MCVCVFVFVFVCTLLAVIVCEIYYIFVARCLSPECFITGRWILWHIEKFNATTGRKKMLFFFCFSSCCFCIRNRCSLKFDYLFFFTLIYTTIRFSTLCLSFNYLFFNLCTLIWNKKKKLTKIIITNFFSVVSNYKVRTPNDNRKLML